MFQSRISAGPTFGVTALDGMARAYPTIPRHLAHGLAGHPLLELDALAALARRMRPASLEHNAATDLPLGLASDQIPYTGLDVHQTIASIADCGSWVVMKSIEQDPAYDALMRDVLAEIEPLVRPRTGPMLRLKGFIFVASPGAVTPLHFDPEHNVLFQMRGIKTMTLFPTADPDMIGDRFFEAYFAGGPRNLPWRPEWKARAHPITIQPGEALYVPTLAPHWAKVHDEVSVALSLTWHSQWSRGHADACRFNRRLRTLGLTPASPRLYPADNRAKARAERALAWLENLASRN
jgi:quercetin dioxygenase-like cupin family protein